MKRIGAALAACGMVVAGPALAEGWVVMDLGETETREICMDRAERILQDYIDSKGGHSVAGDSWTKYGYDLEPGDNDVLIMCPLVNGGLYNGFMAVYGAFEDDADDHTDPVAEELQRMWNAEAADTPDQTPAERAAAELDRALAALDEARAAVVAAQDNLRNSLAGDDHDEFISPPEGEGDEEDWIDLDEVLQPLKQEFREGAPPPSMRDRDPAETAPQPREGGEAEPEEDPEFEDIAPVDPR